jgi:hypothetical protein
MMYLWIGKSYRRYRRSAICDSIVVTPDQEAAIDRDTSLYEAARGLGFSHDEALVYVMKLSSFNELGQVFDGIPKET